MIHPWPLWLRRVLGMVNGVDSKHAPCDAFINNHLAIFETMELKGDVLWLRTIADEDYLNVGGMMHAIKGKLGWTVKWREAPSWQLHTPVRKIFAPEQKEPEWYKAKWDAVEAEKRGGR